MRSCRACVGRPGWNLWMMTLALGVVTLPKTQFVTSSSSQSRTTIAPRATISTPTTTTPHHAAFPLARPTTTTVRRFPRSGWVVHGVVDDDKLDMIPRGGGDGDGDGDADSNSNQAHPLSSSTSEAHDLDDDEDDDEQEVTTTDLEWDEDEDDDDEEEDRHDNKLLARAAWDNGEVLPPDNVLVDNDKSNEQAEGLTHGQQSEIEIISKGSISEEALLVEEDEEEEDTDDVFLDAQEFLEEQNISNNGDIPVPGGDEELVELDEDAYEYQYEDSEDDDEFIEQEIGQAPSETLLEEIDSDSLEQMQQEENVAKDSVQEELIIEESVYDDDSKSGVESDDAFQQDFGNDTTPPEDDVDEFIESPQNDIDEAVQDVLVLENDEDAEETETEFGGGLGQDVASANGFQTPTSTEDASQIESGFSGEVQVEAGTIATGNVDSETRVDYAKAETEKGAATIEFAESTTKRDDASPQEAVAIAAMVEAEATEEETAFVAATQAASSSRSEAMYLSQQHTTDDDSMAFEDRMQLADDEGEAVLSEFQQEDILESMEEVDQTLAVEDDEAAELEGTDQRAPVEKGATTAFANAQSPEQTASLEEESKAKADPSCDVIDEETRRILIKELKFHRREVKCMRPEIGVVVAKKRLRRPCEGMPPNWYTEEAKQRKEKSAGTSRRQAKRIIRIALLPIVYAVPIALSSLAIYGSADLVGMVSSLSSGAPVKTDDDREEEIPSPPDEQGTENLSQSSLAGTGGIAPFDDTSIPAKGDEEESWLDKLITGVSKTLKAFWEMEL